MADDPMRLRGTKAPPSRAPAPTPPMRQWIDQGITKLEGLNAPPPDEGPSNTDRLRGARSEREAAAVQAKMDAAQSQSREGGAAGAFFKSSDQNRQEIRLTKQQETQAAIATLKQQEGKPLSDTERQLLAGAGMFNAATAGGRDLYSVQSGKRVMHEPTKKNIAATGEAQRGIMAGEEAQVQAKLESERQVEAFRARVSLEDEMVRAGMAAKQQAQDNAVDEGLQAVKESQRLVADAAQKFQRTPAVDPDRYWASRTAKQKFGAVMLGVVKGLLKQDPVGHIQRAIAEDVAAQKSDLDQAQRQFGALGDAYTATRGAYQDIRGAVDDERTADLIYERARLDQAGREFEWWLQKGQVSQLTAAHQTFQAELAQRTANLDLEIAKRTASNPRTYTKVRKTLPKDLHNLAIRGLEKEQDLGVDLIKGGYEQAGKERVESIKNAGGGPTEGDKSRSVDQRKWIAEKTVPYRTELQLINEFQEKYANDIPGVGNRAKGAIAGAATGFQTGFVPGAIIGGIVGAAGGGAASELTAEQRDARSALTRIVMVRLRRESGAAIGEGELYRDAERIVDGWTDEDVNRELSARRQEATSNIDYWERAPDMGEVEQYRRANMQDPRALSEQAGVPDPTSIDEDAIPYANPR
jgi:hypothetical protein